MKFLAGIRGFDLVLVCLTPFLLCVAFLGIIASDRTLAPTDDLLVTPQLYSPGNGALTHNPFNRDVVHILLPWKYYFYKFDPAPCSTVLSGPLGSTTAWGYELPDKLCYPFEGVRPYLKYDSFFVLKNFFDFFTSYDLSYLFCLLWFYCAALWFFMTYFCVSLKTNAAGLRVSVLCAGLFTTSFTVARHLQNDEFIATMPPILLALGCLNIYARDSKNKFLWGSLFFLLVSCLRSQIQVCAIVVIAYLLYALIWQPRVWKQKLFLKSLALALPLSGSISLFYYRDSIQLFLINRHHFLPPAATDIYWFWPRRVGVLIFSFINLVFGEIFFAFNTVDFTKILGKLGARDVLSYDNSGIFLGVLPALLLVNAFLLPTVKLPSVRKFALATGAIAILSVAPSYRFLYFRFYQWWMALSVLMFCGEILEQKSLSFTRRALLFFGSVLVALPVFALIIKRLGGVEVLERRFGSGGTLGWEPGYWAHRITLWIERLEFRDFYSLTYLVSVAAVAYVLRELFKTNPPEKAKSRLWFALILISALSGLLLNTFNYSRPQPREILYRLIENFDAPERTFAFQPNFYFPQNLNLLVNRKAHQITESLFWEIPTTPR